MASNINYDLSNELSYLREEEPSSSEISSLNDCFSELDTLTKSHDDFLSAYLNSSLGSDYEGLNGEYTSFISQVESFQGLWSGADSNGSPSGGTGGGGGYPGGSVGGTASAILNVPDSGDDDGGNGSGDGSSSKKKKIQKIGDDDTSRLTPDTSGNSSDDGANDNGKSDLDTGNKDDSQNNGDLSNDSGGNNDSTPSGSNSGDGDTNNSANDNNNVNNDTSSKNNSGAENNSNNSSGITSGNGNINNGENTQQSTNDSNLKNESSTNKNVSNNNFGSNKKLYSASAGMLNANHSNLSNSLSNAVLDRLDTTSTTEDSVNSFLTNVDDSIKDLGESIMADGKTSLLNSNLLNFGKIQSAIDKNKNDSKINWWLLALIASGTATGGYIFSKKLKEKQADDENIEEVESWK